MAYFATKTTLGFKKVSEEDADFHIETIEEYYRHKNTARYAQETIAELQNLKAELEEKILELEKETDDLKEKYINAYKDGVNDGSEDVTKEKEKYYALNQKYKDVVRKLKGMETELVSAEEAVDRKTLLNMHFLRVSKERANRENGQPKKEGTGYVVINTAQITDRVENPSARYDPYETIFSWRTTIRTPYSVYLPLTTIADEIRTDLIDTVLGPMGINILQIPEKNGEYTYPDGILDEEDKQASCFVYRYLYHSNMREGFWEIDLFHDKPIFVPEEFRIIQKNNQKGSDH